MIYKVIANLERIAPWQLLCLFILLISPVFFSGFHADDYFHQLLLQDESLRQQTSGSLFGLFSFVDASDQHHVAYLKSMGVLPWFAEADFGFQFWRPVAELTHYLDYLLGGSPFIAHVHSVLWFILLVVVVGRYVGQTIDNSKPFLMLFLFVFMLDGQHVANIHWVANRNVVIAAVFVFVSLLQFSRWLERKDFTCLMMSLFFSLVALLSSEMAVVGLMFIVAHLACFYAGVWSEKVIKAAPFVILYLGWLAVYYALGYGSTSDGLYVNPQHDVLAFLLDTAEKMLIYLASLFYSMPSGLSWVGGYTYPWLANVVLVVSMVLVVPFIIITPKLCKGDKRVVFLLLCSLGALLPACLSLPQDRLTLFSTVMVDALLVLMFFEIVRQKDRGSFRAIFAVVFFLCHLVISPAYLLAGNAYMGMVSKSIESNAEELITGNVPKVLVTLQGPIGEVTSLMGIRRYHGLNLPSTYLWLANDEGDMTVSRAENDVLIIERTPHFIIGHEEVFFSGYDNTFEKGRVIRVGDASIEIMALNAENLPTKIALSFPGTDWGDVEFNTFVKGRFVSIKP